MKGVSTVIATILMLMITIGLAGLAASYFFNLADQQTDVVLGLDSADCGRSEIQLWIKNDGQDNSGQIKIYIDGLVDNGTFNYDDMVEVTANMTPQTNDLGPGQMQMFEYRMSTNPTDTIANISIGTKNIRLVNPRSTARGTVFCSGV